jgi:hypothetical protein
MEIHPGLLFDVSSSVLIFFGCIAHGHSQMKC